MTHDNPSIIHVSDFFARVIWKVLEGETPIFAMREVREEHFRQSLLGQWTAEGIETRSEQTAAPFSSLAKFVTSKWPSD